MQLDPNVKVFYLNCILLIITTQMNTTFHINRKMEMQLLSMHLHRRVKSNISNTTCLLSVVAALISMISNRSRRVCMQW